MSTKRWIYLTLALVLVVGLIGMPTRSASAAPSVIYDATSATLPPNLLSLGFQATQTAEFGDYIHLAGTNRVLRTVTVTMSTWALHSSYPAMDSSGWTHPITLNIYNVIPGTPNGLGTLIATRTQTFTIPWRPEADPTCSTPTAWRAGDGVCYNGYAFNITFDMSSLLVTLPNDIIVGVAYNTNTWGYSPIGAPGPYESLNVGAVGSAIIGTDDNTDNVFWNTMTATWYADGGAGGVGTFREDTNWTPNGTLPIQITADSAPTEFYVNSAWSAIAPGVDPDGAGPAIMMGFDAFATIQPAIDAAAAGNTINIQGTHVLTSAITVNKAVILSCDSTGLIQVSGTGERINMIAAGATLQGCSIEKTDKTGVQNIIYIGASNLTIQNNKIWGKYVINDGDISRAMVVTGGLSGLLITGNEIYDLRQPAYISGVTTGTISNNLVYRTKGWVLEQGNMTFTNNTWGTGANANVYDIAILSGVNPIYYTDIPAMSAANNNAFIEDQRTSPATLSIVYVDGSVVTSGDGTARSPKKTITEGVARVIPGGIIHVLPGTYIENVVVNKSVEIAGAGQSSVTVIPAVSAPNPCTGSSLCGGTASNVFLVQANNVTIHDLTVDGDNPALTSTYDRGGANLDARNGIIKNTDATYSNLVVYNTTVRNIYLRGIYSTGGSFNFHHNTVTNVQGDGFSIGMFAWYGPGIMANNTVSYANDGISANHSNGIQFLNNTITHAGSGIHTDNSGDGGGVADVIRGNTVSDCAPNGYGIWTFVPYLAPVVDQNTVTNCEIGLSAWGQGAPVTVNFTNNTVTGNLAAGSVGVYVTTDWISWGYSDISVSFQNNVVTNFDTAVALEAGPQTWNTYPYVAQTINADFIHNQFTNNTNGFTRGTTGTYNANASPNWWGSIAGPGPSVIPAGIPYSPWCGDAACSFLVPNGSGVFEIPAGTSGADAQAILDNAPDGSTIKFLGSPLANTGGYLINHPHTTILLANGTVIQNNSPCFVVNADYVTITTESIGGAQCVPTSDSNGIDVTGPRVNLTVQGIDFVGAAGTDGIHFAGAITDLVIVDNWFHGFPEDGIEFTVQPAGVLDIHGNLFQANAGRGINASTFTVPAEYNSWGHAAAPVAGVDMSSGVDADPWTHVDLSMASSGTPWANQVVRGQTITYTVYANLVNANAADFTLLYPANLTYVSSTLGGTFDTELFTQTDGSLNFRGYDLTGSETGNNVTLFSATFTAASVGTAPMNLDETTDGFGMIASGSSSNIYAAALADGSVTVIDLPTLTSSDFGPFVQGIQQVFHLTITNPAGGAAFASPALVFSGLPTGTLEYWDGASSSWVAWPATLAPIAANSTQELTFRATFTGTPGSYPSVVTLNDTVPNPDQQLATLSQTVVLYGRPTLSTTDLQGYYLTGDAQEFHVTVTNPADGATWTGLSLAFAGFPLDAALTGTFTIASLAPSASTTLTFTATFATADSYPITAALGVTAYPQLALLPSTTAVVYTKPTITGNLAGPYLTGIPSTVNLTVTNPSGIPGPFNMVFDLPAGTLVNGAACPAGCTVPVTLPAASNDLSFTIQFAAAYTGTVGVSLYDTLPDPDRLLATLSQTGAAYANLSITGTISMQGRTFRGGVPVTLTAVLVPYGPYTATSINQISTNLSFSNVAAGDYVITTNQPRYLNLDVALNKTVALSSSRALSPLELKGGNAVWTDNVINVNDASRVGTYYGQTIVDDADVNFSGKVDVFDLALVGGNFNLTSATAYGTWVP